MPLHQGPAKPDERSLSVNPFYGEADPVSGMTEAPRNTGCRTDRRRPRRPISSCTTS